MSRLVKPAAGEVSKGIVVDKDEARRRVAERAIADLRRRLLDLSNRNRLLNFKFSDRARTHVRVIDELPDVLAAKLVAGKTLTFAPLPEPENEPREERNDEFLMAVEEARMGDDEYRRAMENLGEEDETSAAGQKIERALKDRVRKSIGLPPRADHDTMTPAEYAQARGFDPSYDLPHPKDLLTASKAAHQDSYVQTLLFPEQMERKLSGIRDGARTASQEMGIDILFTAFGYLEWYESDASQQKMFAPLLLHPVEMQRTLVGQTYRYSITGTGDDTEINITLKERLVGDFGLVLPGFEAGDSPEKYFARVEEAVEQQKHWRVRRFVTVGLFAFSRLVMYQDLDPKRWPEVETLHLHPVALSLFGGTEKSQAVFASDYEVDEPGVAAKVPLLVTEADSSQFSAIVDVMDGKNLAIKGPPGTGKSQTITNVIAAALAGGKKVLFVAEKMAALEVVKKRLDDAGLGDFCLELHSTKAHKKDVLDSLRMRRELQGTTAPAALRERIEGHERCREQLTRYAVLMNTPVGTTGRTLHEHLWAYLRAADQWRRLGLPTGLDRVFLEGALLLRQVDCENCRKVLETLERRLAAFGNRYRLPGEHPWAAIGAAEINPFEQEELLRATRAWHSALARIESALGTLRSDTGMPDLSTLNQARALVGVVALLPGENETDLTAILARLPSWNEIEKAEGFLKAVALQRESAGALSGKTRIGAEALDIRLLKELMVGADSVCSRTGMPTLRAGEIAAEVTRRRDLAKRTRACASFARQVLQAAGLEAAPSLGTFLTVLKAIDVARATPHKVLARRSPALLGDGSRETLEAAAAQAHLLKEKQQSLTGRLAPAKDANTADYRRHAASLRSAGWFGSILRADARRARAVWKSTQRDLKRAPADQMVRDLEEIAGHLDAVRAFVGDGRLRELCGKDFEGLATDFDLLRAVSDFGRDVARQFSGPSLGHCFARRLLLDENVRTIGSLFTLVDEQTSKQLQTFLSTAPQGVSDNDADLEDIANADDRLADELDRLRTLTGALGILDSVPLAEFASVAEHAERAQSLARRIEEDDWARHALGDSFAGTESDCTALTHALQVVRQVHGHDLPGEFFSWLLSPDFARHAGALRSAQAEVEDGLRSEAESRSGVLRIGQATPALLQDLSENGVPIRRIAERLDGMLNAEEELPFWVEFSHLRARAAQLGLTPILSVYEDAQQIPKHLAAAFDFVFHRTILRRAYDEHPDLSRFGGVSQQAVREQFQELDRGIVELKRRELSAMLAAAFIPTGIGMGPKKDWTDLALIDNELSKKRRHIPLRDLFLRAGTAIQEMKPCWMMSPPSVAQFLTPEGVRFDLVVIDEASQMKPEDALGALGRGRQLVVVGDPQQLPPTSFFERIEAPDEHECDREDCVDTESILDLALATFHPARHLRWHYRSRHESLIAFSNERFYDGTLVVFPAAVARGRDLGVEYRKVDGLYTPKARTNLQEARAVADMALDFMLRNVTLPEEKRRSLGIVTMNQSQRDVLMEEIDRLCVREPLANEYRKHFDGTLEPFFVKNLENVQGDERDVIFASTVYGPDAPGRRVAQRFGPVNSMTGHRRLNVLFTRAKEKVVVFSSMEPTDVLISETSRPGVAILKHYLNYAKTGQIDPGTLTGRDPDSDFEVFVAGRLQQHGYEVVPQVGVGGYFIDLAIKHPNDPSSYILGVECDGATYHSAKSARDRDRLRQEVLERLGWRLYRIWSTDWFGNPEGETKRLVEHLVQLRTTDETKRGYVNSRSAEGDRDAC